MRRKNLKYIKKRAYDFIILTFQIRNSKRSTKRPKNYNNLKQSQCVCCIIKIYTISYILNSVSEFKKTFRLCKAGLKPEHFFNKKSRPRIIFTDRGYLLQLIF